MTSLKSVCKAFRFFVRRNMTPLLVLTARSKTSEFQLDIQVVGTASANKSRYLPAESSAVRPRAPISINGLCLLKLQYVSLFMRYIKVEFEEFFCFGIPNRQG